jgi:hypothetical protein
MGDTDHGPVRVFNVETRFQQMARRPGGVPREKAIEEATISIEAKKPGFDDWVHTEMQGLAAAVDVARTGAPMEEWAGRANLHARAMRDVGTTMGAALLTDVANQLCDVLDAIEAGAAWDIETLGCYFDALVLVRQPDFRGVGPEQVPELMRGLRRLAARFNAPEDAPSVVPES